MSNKVIKKLIEYDLAYEIGKSKIDDIEYDKFKNDAKLKYPNDSYFKTVGAPSDALDRTIKLPYIMGSLDKVNTGNVLDWAKGKGYLTASEKIDGVSILCTWKNKKPVFLALRGNGEDGQDITSKAKYFIPDINIDDEITLRGEAVLTGDAYKKLNYKNNRNGTAGILNRKDDERSKLELLKTYFYEIISADYIPSDEYERFLYIGSLGLNTPDFTLLTLNDIPNIINTLVTFIQNSKKYKPYDIDGIVLSKNNSDRENVLFPKNKVAFKIQNEEVVTEVKDINWQPSRFGRLKPVISVFPVEIGGVTISNVTGFNASYIENNGIGKGAKISIIRSGDVIPYITGILEQKETKFPKKCPSCGATIKMVGDDLICDSIYCSDSGYKRVAYFFKTLGMKGFSEKNVEKLGLDDLFKVSEYEHTIRSNCSWSMYNRYLTNIRQVLCSGVLAYKLLAGFGIPGIGEKVAKDICEKLNITDNNSFQKLFTLDAISIDIGDKTKISFCQNIMKYKTFFEDLVSKFNLVIKNDNGGGILSNMTFVITGTHYTRRSNMVYLIESNGGKVSSTVNSKTTALIANSYQKNTVKYIKAENLKIPILDWTTFKERYKI